MSVKKYSGWGSLDKAANFARENPISASPDEVEALNIKNSLEDRGFQTEGLTIRSGKAAYAKYCKDY